MQAMKNANVDVLIAPAMSPAWPTDLVLGRSLRRCRVTALRRFAAIRASRCRWAKSHGLPIGVVFVGPAWSEAKLLSVGYAYEQRSKLRRAPTFAPTVTPGEDGVCRLRRRRDAGVDDPRRLRIRRRRCLLRLRRKK
jgi:amidase